MVIGDLPGHTTSDNELHITFVVGAPGSGKGTLCKRLARERGDFHLSIGDYLRKLDSGEESYPKRIIDVDLIKTCLNAGELVPPNEIVNVLEWKLNALFQEEKRSFLVDRFPRDEKSAELFVQKITKPEVILSFDCPKGIAKERVLERARNAADSEEKFDKRYAEFELENQKVLDVLESKWEVRCLKVDTSGKTEESWPKLVEALGLNA